MKTLFFISILILFIFSSCQEEKTEPITFPYRAEVIGPNEDCGIFAIRFTSDLDKIEKITGRSTVGSIFIAENLPVELQQSGLKIILDIRKIKDNELRACITMGPAYPWLFVLRAVEE